MESIQKTELESRVLELCEGVLTGRGYRVIDLDCRVAGRSLVRLFIERTVSEASTEKERDKKPGTASIDDCAEASRVVSTLLDDPGVLPGAYDLEVSSPGLDRRLRLEADFQSVVGNDIKLKLRESIPGLGANVTGRLEAVEGGALRVLSQKKEWPIRLGQIVRANVVWREG